MEARTGGGTEAVWLLDEELLRMAAVGVLAKFRPRENITSRMAVRPLGTVVAVFERLPRPLADGTRARLYISRSVRDYLYTHPRSVESCLYWLRRLAIAPGRCNAVVRHTEDATLILPVAPLKPTLPPVEIN